MDTQQILDRLSHYSDLPVEALRAAGENREVVLPTFIAEIDGFVAALPEERSGRNPLFFIFHLLGSWREKSAYRSLARLLRLPRAEVRKALGEAITSTSHQVMAAVFDGDPRPLYDVIQDDRADEFSRSRMLETLAMATLAGRARREETKEFLATCWDELQPREDCFVWNGWQSAIAMLGLSELRPLVLRAFAHGEIDQAWLEVRHFERDLKYALQNNGRFSDRQAKEYRLFGDTIEELQSWYGFLPKPRVPRPWEHQRTSNEIARLYADWELRPSTTTNPTRDIGRNNPCPCGSGKKFKRCCLASPALIE